MADETPVDPPVEPESDKPLRPRPDLFKGANLIPGNPGNKGPGKGMGTGRKPNAWKAMCKEWLENPEIHAAVFKRLKRGEHAMMKLVVESAEGLPDQKITHAVEDAAALDALLDRLAPPSDPPVAG